VAVTDVVTRRTLLTPLANKVPRITAGFWLAKILTTGMGEATSDFLAHRFGSLPAVAIAGPIFALALWWQLSLRRYVVPVYWFTVVMVSVFGTMVADGLHVELGIPYDVSSTLLVVALVVIFAWWQRVEGTLSIHSITTTRRELFYWLSVCATFALGTAAGDLTATTFSIGFLASGFLFLGLICLPAAYYWRLRRHEIVSFWIAYVLTRPLGASFADYLGVAHSRGGLNWGPGTVALASSLVIVVVVAVLWRRETTS